MLNEEIVRDAIVRSVAVVGLAGVALIHVLDAHDTFVATPYKGWLYVGLIAGSLLAAGALVRRNDTRAWAAAGALSLAAFLAFVYSRTVGLPASADDIGNWWEPLGLSSLFVEGSLVAVSDANPLLAIEDALRTFAAEEIVVVTQPEHRSHWLAHEIAARARARFPHPVHEIVAA